MEIVIAILLALILVAMVSTNKDAAQGVGRVIRIGIFLFFIGLAWVILIGYSVFYYFSYTEQGWYNLLGIAFPVLIPPFVAWANRDWIKELFSKDNKTMFKTLAYLLIGVIAWVTVSILYQEHSKVDPDFGKTILLFTFIISGCFLINRALDKGWKTAFSFQPSPWDAVNNKYDAIVDEENRQWEKTSKAIKSQEDSDSDEYARLADEHYDRYDAIEKERYAELEKVRGVKKKDDWLLLAFYWSIAFAIFGLLGQLWDYAFAWVMTLGYVKGREWVAYASLIGGILAAIGAIVGILDDMDKRKLGK